MTRTKWNARKQIVAVVAVFIVYCLLSALTCACVCVSWFAHLTRYLWLCDTTFLLSCFLSQLLLLSPLCLWQMPQIQRETQRGKTAGKRSTKKKEKGEQQQRKTISLSMPGDMFMSLLLIFTAAQFSISLCSECVLRECILPLIFRFSFLFICRGCLFSARNLSIIER